MSRRRARLLVTLAVAALALVMSTSIGTAEEAPALPEVDSVALADREVTPGWQGAVPSDSDLVGVKWNGDPDAQFTVEVQRGTETWEPVSEVGAVDFGPDPGTEEAAHAAAVSPGTASEPVWVGEDVSAVRVRLDDGTVDDVALQEVDASTTTTTATSALLAGRSLGWISLVGAGIGLILTSRRRLALLAIAAVALTGCFTPPPPPSMVSRDSWGGDLPWACEGGPEYAPAMTSEIIHHTVNSNNYAAADSTNLLRNMWGYHVFTLGYCDIAYNFLVDRYGTLFEGRRGGISSAVIGAHAAGHNVGSSGMALIGDFTTAQPPADAFTALKDLMVWKFQVQRADPKPDYAIVAHRQVTPTICPGDGVDMHMPGIRTEVRSRIAGG